MDSHVDSVQFEGDKERLVKILVKCNSYVVGLALGRLAANKCGKFCMNVISNSAAIKCCQSSQL